MNCSEPSCHRPAFVECDTCGAQRCVNHYKPCDDCGKTLCNSFDATCYAAHDCPQPTQLPETWIERVDRVIARAH